MVEILLGGKTFQHWHQFKSQATGLPILGVLDEDDKESSREDEDDKGKGQGTEFYKCRYSSWDH
eukprot:1339442-Ditylum_brightwellii.AAC.2